MNRKLRLLLIVTVPVFVFVNIFQTYSFQRMQDSVTVLESKQKSWLERNKRIIAGIAVLSSPERIDQIAKEKLDLKARPLEPSLRIRVPEGSRANDG